MALSKCAGTSFSAAVNGNNQFTGYTYDAAGNLTNDGLYSYTYDAESEITTANGVTYTYDGNRMRVAKSSAPLYWRDINANTIAQTALNGTNQAEFVFFGGRRVARVNANGLVYYYQADQIGSTRSMTNSSGVRCYDADFPPYGTENSYTGTCSPIYKFAAYERDTETGLDYAASRYYNSRIGRFMTPDPAGLASAVLRNAQSMNRYSYVLNNPLGLIDPTGLGCIFISSGDASIEDVDPKSTDYDSAECSGTGFYGEDGFVYRKAVWEKRQSDSCEWLMKEVCGWFFDRGALQNNKDNDLEMFNITQTIYQNAYTIYTTNMSDQFFEINRLEQVNLRIDEVALKKADISILNSIPKVDLLPPGINKVEDMALDNLEGARDRINAQIDQLLQSIHQ